MAISTDEISSAAKKARKIFKLCKELSDESERPISPDGHLVGGLGELFAAAEFGIELAEPSTKGYDGHLAEDDSATV